MELVLIIKVVKDYSLSVLELVGPLLVVKLMSGVGPDHYMGRESPAESARENMDFCTQLVKLQRTSHIKLQMQRHTHQKEGEGEGLLTSPLGKHLNPKP